MIMRFATRQRNLRQNDECHEGTQIGDRKMSADHGLSERAYISLKSDLIEGRLAPGRVHIGRLADRYGMSATPVREAMLRLVGETLLEMPPAGGFEIPALNEAAVRNLYAISQYVMLTAAACRGGLHVEPNLHDGDMSDLPPPIEELFDSIAKATRNVFLTAFVQNLNDHMRRIRRAEERKLTGLGREFSAISSQIERGSRQSMRRAIIAYHRRRIRYLPEIMSVLSHNRVEKNPS